MPSQAFVEEMKHILLETQARFKQEMEGLPLHTEMGDDQEANSDEINPDEVNSDVRAQLQADLEKIEKALGKISAGTYGTDDEGREIPEDRLRVLPWAESGI